MARKSKRLVLNEAIRQGQARIAEGLKTGQMRSEGPSGQNQSEGKEGLLSPDKNDDYPRNKWVDALKSKEKSRKASRSVLQNKSMVLVSAGSVVILGLVIWTIMAVFTGSDEINPVDTDNSPVNRSGRGPGNEPVVGSERAPVFAGTENGPPEAFASTQAADNTPGIPVVADGDNVIWIQSIALSRKDELVPLSDFFRRKGVETEIVVHRDSGDAILVTKAGFKENPRKRGTQGYKLLQQIQRLGVVYVEETKDTKFGVKPFQDALGYKR